MVPIAVDSLSPYAVPIAWAVFGNASRIRFWIAGLVGAPPNPIRTTLEVS